MEEGSLLKGEHHLFLIWRQFVETKKRGKFIAAGVGKHKVLGRFFSVNLIHLRAVNKLGVWIVFLFLVYVVWYLLLFCYFAEIYCRKNRFSLRSFEENFILYLRQRIQIYCVGFNLFLSIKRNIFYRIRWKAHASMCLSN